MQLVGAVKLGSSKEQAGPGMPSRFHAGASGLGEHAPVYATMVSISSLKRVDGGRFSASFLQSIQQ